MNIRNSILKSSVALLMNAALGLTAQITFPTQSATPGTTIADEVTFSSQSDSVSGIEFDIDYDSSAMNLTASLGTPAEAAGKVLYSVDVTTNRKRFLIVGFNQSVIPDGILINLSVNIHASVVSGTYSLAPSNIYGADPTGEAVGVNGNYGILTVNASSPARLTPDGVANAASFLPGPVAPGELVSLAGSGVGPAFVQRPIGSATNTVLAGTSVLFDGVAAPLLYAAPNQINAIVPYEVSGRTATQITVVMNGQTIAAVAQPVTNTAPAVFTLDSSGRGPGAILNQDLSVNSPSNPAAKGSVIAIYATGAGQMNPAGLDGQVTGTVLASLTQPVSVQIGGLDAEVVFSGAAPDIVSGVIQVNALIPSVATAGAAIPIVLKMGQAASQPGVTVAVR